MAYERISDTKSRGEGLDTFVQTIMQQYQNQLALRNAEEEGNFYRNIVDNNLSVAEQLDYRKAQLARVGDDPAERKRLRTEIATLKSRADQQKFTEDYQEKVANVAAGITSLDSVISWLEDQRQSATDPDLRVTIGSQIAQKQNEKLKKPTIQVEL